NIRHNLLLMLSVHGWHIGLNETEITEPSVFRDLANIPDFVGVGELDGIEAGYCDINNKIIQPRQDWAKQILDDDRAHLEMYTYLCFENLPDFFKGFIFTLKQQFNQTEGVHIVQRIDGCEWDENTGEVTGVLQYGYDGEDFLKFDIKTLTWIALKPEAAMIKQSWDADINDKKDDEDYFTRICPERLKMYLDSGKSSLQRTVLPSVSLLQKTPSSPVSCHATGFYPDRAGMFWRKDGEELHEGVDLGEILSNNDGTFQTSVDLNVSSVTPEDWERYHCVFQFYSVNNDMITKLDRAVIRTNMNISSFPESFDDVIVMILGHVGPVFLVFMYFCLLFLI
uniref:Major histocompatibility complex class I-related gene protein-like n=1 Tax=Pundamilia nyererei TaxID=303518 RepID=A0A3B4G7W2_9CICH